MSFNYIPGPSSPSNYKVTWNSFPNLYTLHSANEGPDPASSCNPAAQSRRKWPTSDVNKRVEHGSIPKRGPHSCAGLIKLDAHTFPFRATVDDEQEKTCLKNDNRLPTVTGHTRQAYAILRYHTHDAHMVSTMSQCSSNPQAQGLNVRLGELTWMLKTACVWFRMLRT